jgi:hypothetical protein
MKAATGSSASLKRAGDDILSALSRILKGAPTHPSLKARLACGRDILSVASVCLEAKRSRTLIGYDGCALPAVRKIVLAAISKRNKPKAAKASIQIAELKRALSHYRDLVQERDTVNAQLMIQVQKLEAEIRRMKRRAERSGKTTSGSTGGEKIVPFRNNRFNSAPRSTRAG